MAANNVIQLSSFHPDENVGKQGQSSLSSTVDSNSYVSQSTLVENLVQMNFEQHVVDATSLTATELQIKYLLTYNSWRSRKSHAKKIGMEFAQCYADFKDFLVNVGPRIHKDYTLDRIDNAKGYIPGNVRWASKTIQGQNKTNVILLKYKGETLPLVAWAQKTDQSPDTLYKRKDKGWSDAEVIEGKQAEKISSSLWNGTPWPKGYEIEWEETYIASKGLPLSRWQFYYHESCRKLEELRLIGSGYEVCPSQIAFESELFQYFRKDAYEKLQAKEKSDWFKTRVAADFSPKHESLLYQTVMTKMEEDKKQNKNCMGMLQ